MVTETKTQYFKELIFNTLLFADDQLIIADTEDNLQRAVYLLYSISKEYNLEIATGKTKVFGFIGTDHLKAKIIINDETLYKVSQFMYLGCSISYQLLLLGKGSELGRESSGWITSLLLYYKG